MTDRLFHPNAPGGAIMNTIQVLKVHMSHMKPSVEKVNFGENPWILARLPCKQVIVWELRNETFRDWE